MKRKTLDFTDSKTFPWLDPKWRKKYVLTELSGGEVLECDEGAFERHGDEVKFSYEAWRILLLQKSMVQPKMSKKQLKSMPASLLTYLLDQATRLNTISREERDFLLKLQHSATEADTT